MCTYCYKVVKPGISHQCNKGVEAITSLMEHISPDTRSQLSFETITVKQEQKMSNSPVQLQSARGGKPTPVVMGTAVVRGAEAPTKLSHETLMQVQNQNDLSNNQIIGIASTLRSSGVPIEPNFRNALYNIEEELAPFFQVQPTTLEVGSGDSIQKIVKPLVLCKNLGAFIQFVLAKRQIQGFQ